MNEREIFAAAMEQPTEAERQAFLDEVCDDDMRQRIERLLKERSQLGSFLEHPPLEAAAGTFNGIDPTIVLGDGSTYDDEGAAISSEQLDMRQNPQDPDDEIPLGYLEPASREDSLGRLGHYEILDVVGKGAFGTVLRAFDEKLERIVAIKVLAPEMASTSPPRKRFLREARTSAAVRHENVVAIHAVEDDPIPYLVMDYIPGKTLQQRLDEQGPLDLPATLRLGKQIADGLAAAHAADLIHRDIKPANILLEGGMDERVKITDFGLARTADDASMTQSGVIAGTPMYMAPEQAHGHKLDARADLFSFGSVLYQMLSGRPPFRASTTMAVLKRVTEDTPRPISEIIPQVPKWICVLVNHLHAKEPADRYGSAKEVSDILAKCLAAVEDGRKPEVPVPARPVEDAEGTEVSEKVGPRAGGRIFQKPWAKVAAVVLLMLLGVTLTEATGVTHVASTVFQLAFPGEGTLVVETNDPGIKISIDGEELTIEGAGVKELTLRPGDYQFIATKDGKPVRQELVTVTRNGRTVLKIAFDPDPTRPSPANPVVLRREPIQWPTDAPPLAIAPFDALQAKKHQQAWADYLGLPVEKEIKLPGGEKLTLVLIPPGEFLMGSTAQEQAKFLEEAEAAKDQWAIDRIPHEGPQHRVRVTRPFYLCKYEVTQAQWQSVMGTNPSRLKHIPSHPVESVSWDEIQPFLAKLNESSAAEQMTFVLPTEAQWEYACRAGTTTPYYGGESADDLRQYGWFNANSGVKTHPVGALKRSTFGLYDMHGNVWEWCADWFASDYYAKPPVDDPTSPQAGSRRVIRGGCWNDPPGSCRSASRDGYTPGGGTGHIGFRPASVLAEK